jgi:hypothetical protein
MEALFRLVRWFVQSSVHCGADCPVSATSIGLTRTKNRRDLRENRREKNSRQKKPVRPNDFVPPSDHGWLPPSILERANKGTFTLCLAALEVN